MFKKIATISAVCLPLLATSAYAVDVTDTMTVSATITASCTITVNSNINFGASIITTSVATDAGPADFDVNCTNTTPYTVGIDNGLNPGRAMTFGAFSADYELYSDSGRTTVYPTIATSAIGGTGNGGNQNYQVWGRMPIQTTPAAGTYNDTVTVTVRY